MGREAAERLFGVSGGKLVSAIITILIIGAISAWTASGPRIYYAMARDGLAPSIFGRLGKRSGRRSSRSSLRRASLRSWP